MHQQQQLPPPSPPPQPPTHLSTTETKAGETLKEAPPKQVAMAMERLGQAARLIADIRLGADRLLEALFLSGDSHQSAKSLNFVFIEESAMRQYLQDLRNIGKQLEDSGVLTEALRSRSNSWGLHMPLVCPDGAVVAYAWKRQLAGQAGASAVDRTRLALKSFVDQKRRFFPHLDIEPAKKKHSGPRVVATDKMEASHRRSFPDIQTCLEKEVPQMKISTYGRLEWLKRASFLSSSPKEDSVDMPLVCSSYQDANNLRPGGLGNFPASEVAVIELLIPSVFRAIVSLHPVGSTNPDAVAFFSPDEGGNYVHARGLSIYHVFRQITEHSNMALQYLLGITSESALYIFLQWISGYETLFTKACSKCERLLAMDKQSAFILPPVYRSYRNFFAYEVSTLPADDSSDKVRAYHAGCFPF